MQTGHELFLSEITKIIEAPTEEKENIDSTFEIMGNVLFTLSSLQNKAAASVWLEKLSHVTLETLDQFTKELSTLESSQPEEKEPSSVVNESRWQIRQIAEWIAQLKSDTTNKLSGLPDFVFTKYDKARFLRLLQERIKNIDAAIMKYVPIDEANWLAQKEAARQKSRKGNNKWYLKKLKKDALEKEMIALKEVFDNGFISEELYKKNLKELEKRLWSVREPPLDINEKDHNGDTALIRAVNDKKLLKVKALLKQGANPNIKNALNETPLSRALRINDPEIAKILLLAGSELPMNDHDVSSSYRPVDRIILEARNNREKYFFSDRHSFEELLFYFKVPSDLKKLMLYALKKRRLDVVLGIMNKHPEDNLTFLNETGLLHEINDHLRKNVSAPAATRMAILKKIHKLNPLLPFKHPKLARAFQKTKEEWQAQAEKPSALLKAVNDSDEAFFEDPAIKNFLKQHEIRDPHGHSLLDLAYTRALFYRFAENYMSLSAHIPEKKMETASLEEEPLASWESNLQKSRKIFLLLFETSNIHAKTVNNQTLLHLAVVEQAPLADFVLFLLKKIDPEARDNAGKRPLDYLLDKKGRLKNDSMEQFKNILEKGIEHLFEPANEATFEEIMKYWEQGNGPERQQAISLLSDHLSIQDKEGNTALMQAIINKNYAQAKSLLQKTNVNVRARNKSGLSALRLAVRHGQTEIVELLIKKGANPNEPVPAWTGRTPILIEAIEKQHIEIVRCLLKAGANPNSNFYDIWMNPLKAAIRAKNIELLKTLLTAGANPNIFSSNIFNYSQSLELIRTAAVEKFPEGMSLVIEAGATIPEGISGFTPPGSRVPPLLLRFKSELNFLLKKGYSLEALSFKLRYPIPLQELAKRALQNKQGHALINLLYYHAEKLPTLSFLTADPLLEFILQFLKENSTYTPAFKLRFLRKIKENLVNIKKITELEEYLQKQERLYQYIQKNSTLKSHATSSHTSPEKKSDTSHKFYSTTLLFDPKVILLARLFDAVEKNNFSALSGIVKENLDLDLRHVRDAEGRTLLDLAYLKYLACRSAAPSFEKENADKIFHFLRASIPENTCSANGQTLLHLAILNQASLEDVLALLLKGLDPNAEDIHHKKPLDYLKEQYPVITENSAADHVKNILEKGIDHLLEPQNKMLLEKTLEKLGLKKENAESLLKAYLNQKDLHGNTVLMRSILNKNGPLTKRLLTEKTGLDLNLFNENQENALLLAVQQGDTQAVSLLLEHGADPETTQPNTGWPVLALAVKNEHLEIVKCLLAHGADPHKKNPAYDLSTALDLAVHMKNVGICRELVAAGAHKGIDKESPNMIQSIVSPIFYPKNHIDFLLKKGRALNELPYLLKYPAALKELALYAVKHDMPYLIINLLNHHIKKLNRFSFLVEEPILKTLLHYLKEDYLATPAFRLSILEKIEGLLRDKGLMNTSNRRKLDKIKNHLHAEKSLYDHVQRGADLTSKEAASSKAPPQNHSKKRVTQGEHPAFFDRKIATTAKILDAVKKNNAPLLSAMLRQNPGVNLNIIDDQGQSLLDLAYEKLLASRLQRTQDAKENNAVKSCESILFLLLEKRQGKTTDSQSLLHCAIKNGAPTRDVILFLLAGVDPAAHDKNWKKPIDYLENKKNPSTARTDQRNLLEQGLSYLWTPQGAKLLVNVLNEFSETPTLPGTQWVISKLTRVAKEVSTKNAQPLHPE